MKCTHEEIANKVFLWQPNDERVKRGRQKINYFDVLLQDTGVTNVAELKSIVMTERTGKTVLMSM